jgi:hypothetical protein
MNCKFTKTYNGRCEQSAGAGKDYCYYHSKVLAGIIESDPILSLRQSQTIINS